MVMVTSRTVIDMIIGVERAATLNHSPETTRLAVAVISSRLVKWCWKGRACRPFLADRHRITAAASPHQQRRRNNQRTDFLDHWCSSFSIQP